MLEDIRILLGLDRLVVPANLCIRSVKQGIQPR